MLQLSEVVVVGMWKRRGRRRGGSGEYLVIFSEEELFVIRNKGINHVYEAGGRRMVSWAVLL
jgi:hypothetical protein